MFRKFHFRDHNVVALLDPENVSETLALGGQELAITDVIVAFETRCSQVPRPLAARGGRQGAAALIARK